MISTKRTIVILLAAVLALSLLLTACSTGGDTPTGDNTVPGVTDNTPTGDNATPGTSSSTGLVLSHDDTVKIYRVNLDGKKEKFLMIGYFTHPILTEKQRC